MRPPVIAITLLSAASLAYEILLIRLFSIIQWHHFAYMIISIALLGFGASGTFITLARRWLQRRFAEAFAFNAAFFACSLLICFSIGQQVPFNPLELVWGFGQFGALCLLYLMLALPFFAAANCVGLTLVQFSEEIPSVYAYNLLGAGMGALCAVILLFLVPPPMALTIIAAVSLVAAAAGAIDLGLCSKQMAVLLLMVALVAVILFHHRIMRLKLSPYKRLSQTLAVIDTEVIARRSSPLGLLTVVRSSRIPFRYAPGLSPNSPSGPPEQLAIFTDGDGMNVITAKIDPAASLDYLDYLTSALPYHLLDTPEVLVLGAGGGADVLQAIFLGARHVDAVELNSQIVDLVADTFSTFSGGLYADKNVHLHVADGRSFISKSDSRYDLIHVALLDAFSASSAGLYALSESFTYTVEGIIEYLQHLQPNGMLAITRWIKLPPRDGPKLIATAVTALERLGVADISDRLALVRSWQTSTLLVKNDTFSQEEGRIIQRFCQLRSFDTAYFPGISAKDANRFNRLPEPYYFNFTQKILSPETRTEFLAHYKFNIAPATDDQPYFFHFFKWDAFWELLSLRAKGGLPLLEQGYLVLIATLAQAALSSLALILAPLLIRIGEFPQPSSLNPWRERIWVVVYFFSLGLGFLFIEMAFIQKFILFFSHPVYATSVVIAAFLLFAGWGSSVCARLTNSQDVHPQHSLYLAVSGIVGISLIYLMTLGPLFSSLLWLPEVVKIILAIGLIAPLAFCMGIPFPLGLRHLSRRNPAMVPWAWGINGCASVISAVLATLLATHFGFGTVLTVALILYAAAALVFHTTFNRPVLAPPDDCNTRLVDSAR